MATNQISSLARGVVALLEGKAWIVNSDGTRQPLQLGDEVGEGLQIITEDGTRLELTLPNGQPLTVASGRELLIEGDLLGTQSTDKTEAALENLNSGSAQIAKIIASGGDLSTELDPTAAGLAGGDASDAHGFVRLLRVNEELTQLSLSRDAEQPTIEQPLTTASASTSEPATSENTATLSISSAASVVEGNAVVYTVSLDKAAGPITTDNGDLVPVTSTVTIAKGATSATFTVNTLDDAYADAGEQFTASINATSGGGFEKLVVGTASVTTTINDENVPDVVYVRIINVAGSVTEGATLMHRVELVDAAGNPVTVATGDNVTVTLSYSADTTVAGDYVSPRLVSITIPAGQSSVLINNATFNDTVAEGTEGYTLSLGSVSGGARFESIAKHGTQTSVLGTINDNDHPPVITGGPQVVAVSEEGLLGGIADSTGTNDTSGNPLSTNSSVYSGQVVATDVDGGPLVFSLATPTTPLTSGGVGLTWVLSNAGHTLTGSAGPSAVMTIEINDSGAYKVSLLKSIDHPDGTLEDALNLPLSVTVSDGTNTASTTVTINIQDDAPTAVASSQTIALASQDTNIMLILDTSGSMNDDADGVSGGPTRMDVMKTSVNMLLDQYDNLGDIKVRIVTFATSGVAQDATWVSIARAKEIVGALVPNNSTNYDAALLTAQTAFASTGKIGGGQNVSYFLTDGQPTASSDWDGSGGPLTSQNGIQPGEQALWESFLTANQIKSMAYGMGTGATQINMDPVAYDGVNHLNMDAIVVPNPAVDLPPILRDSILTPTSGNLFGMIGAGSNIGADGGGMASVTLNGTTYNSGGSIATGTRPGSYDAATNSWTVLTVAGGKFVVDMDDGQYSYTPPALTATTFTESIGYTLLDRDGDSASSTLTLNVVPPQVITLTSTNVTLTGSNLGLSGEYFGYNDNRDGVAADNTTKYSGQTRLHADDGKADAGVANNVDTLADVEAIIEGRDGRTNLINNAILVDPLKADATFSANKLEFGLQAGTSTPLFSTNLGHNNVVTSGAIGASGNNLSTFLQVSAGNADSLAATSGLGDTTDAIVRMVGYIAIPTAGSYDLRVTADDGYRVLIGGQNVAQLDQIQSTATNVYTGKVISEGLQSIEILYWDQGGHATLRIEVKATGAADSTYKILGTDEFAMFSPTEVPTLTANQDLVETATNGVWAVRTGETYHGTDNAEKIVGSDGRDTIDAGAGNDIVQGGAGSDTLSGGQGNDTLTGGLGADTFHWQLTDRGTVGSPAVDVVTDFSAAAYKAGGDALDLRDLLQGENHASNSGNLTQYLHFAKVGGDTELHISSSGAYSGTFTAAKDDQVIRLSGVDLTASGSLTDSAIITDLLNKGKLIVD